MESKSTNSRDITLEQALEEIKELTAKNDELSDDLEECRDQLFTLLQRETDVSEQTISDAYSRIFEGLDSWIDEISTTEGFEVTFKLRYQDILKRTKEERTKALGLGWVCQDLEWLVKLGKLETCRYVVLAHIVMKCLVEHVFRVEDCDNWENIYPFGFSSKEVDFLVQVQEAMANDENQRESSQIGRWRKEAVVALLATERIQERAFERAARVRRRLQEDLAFWIDNAVLEKYMESLETKVLQRAYRALDLLGRSSKSFMFSGDDLQAGPIQPNFATSPVRDISTWSNMASAKALGVLQCVYLGLVRIGDFDEEDLTLVHPILLGYSSPEMEPKISLTEVKFHVRQETYRTDKEEPEPTSSTRSSRLRRKRYSSKHVSRPVEAKPPHALSRKPTGSISWGDWILGPEAKAFSKKVFQRFGKSKDSTSRTQRRDDSNQDSRPAPSSGVAYYGPNRSIRPEVDHNTPEMISYYTKHGHYPEVEDSWYENQASQYGYQPLENEYIISRDRTE